MTTIRLSPEPGPDPRNSERPARLHHGFCRQASVSPDAIALLHRGSGTSYRALDERSNRIAHLLRARGVAAGMLVGLCLDRGPDLVAALLGGLKAGVVVVPLDPAHPHDRLATILADCSPAAVIASATMAACGSVERIGLDDGVLAALPCSPLVEDGDETGPDAFESPACIFYTSGSTGQPKGVVLGHTAVNYLDWAQKLFTGGELDRVAATTSACFDPFLFEVLAPLGVGGTIILKRDLLEPFEREEQPSLLNGVPSAFAELVRGHGIPGSVRAINVGGERLPASLAKAIHVAVPGVRLWNHYGPTETTICASVAEIRAGDDAEPPIGRPIAGAVFQVLDDALRPVRPGERGELFIGGPNLAIGYLGRPDQTGESFVADPASPGERLYRTGDIVRATADGSLLFVGRKGRQIKFRGYRIELDEIETAVARLPGIEAAAVLAVCDERGVVVALRAVLAPAGAWTLPRLRRSLRHALPRHMLPNRLALVDEMPLTATGKIDRSALRALPDRQPDVLDQPDPWLPPWTEAILIVFRDVLGQPSLRVDDDFFDHGGDSLMATDAMLRIEALLGLKGAAPLTHHAGSAAALSGLLMRQRENGHDPCDARRLIPLATGGAAPALFCVAESADRPLQALALAVRLATDRPVLSLVAGPGGMLDADHRAALPDRIVGMPILLLAAGDAAHAATELAGRMQADGYEVVLVLVSPTAPAARSGPWLRLRASLSRLVPGSIGRASAEFTGRTLLVTGTSATHRAARGVELISLPAEDGTLLREPAVVLLAEALRSRLPGGPADTPIGRRAALSPVAVS